MSKNYEGIKHGKLTVLNKIDDFSYSAQCDCGEITTIKHSQISGKRKLSCGCLTHKGVIPGKIVNRLEILEEFVIRKQRRLRIKCFCGKVFDTVKARIISKETQSCGCIKRDKHLGEISQQFWSRIVNGAKKRRNQTIEFKITREYAWNLFLQQERKCIYSGLELNFPIHYKELQSSNYTASLDRIDSSKGYIEGNVQWVHKWVNVMKNQLSHDCFIGLCSLIAQKHHTINPKLQELLGIKLYQTKNILV